MSHFNQASKKIEPLVESKIIDGKNKIFVAGTDLMKIINDGRKNKLLAETPLKNLKRFMRSEEGVATIDGIAAIYLALESSQVSPEVEKFKIPLGAIRTALELVTGQYNGIDHLSLLVTADKIKKLQSNCSTASKCTISNKLFSLHSSGFFDVLSSRKLLKKSNVTLNSSCAKQNIINSKITSAIVTTNSADSECRPEDCCGLCGIECTAPLGIVVWTQECAGHDICVGRYGHSSCLFDVPEDCVGCNSLLDALGSFFCELFPIFCGNEPDPDTDTNGG